MTTEAIRALAQPFKASEISVRIGNSYSTPENSQRAVALAYIERQTAQTRLDEVCVKFGYSWNSEKQVIFAEPMRIVVKTKLCLVHIETGVITEREEYGEASGDATKSELFKSASSDSFKRAASEFGVGRYLHATPNVWFELENRYRFKESDEAIIARLYRKMGLDEHIDFDSTTAQREPQEQPPPRPQPKPTPAPVPEHVPAQAQHNDNRNHILEDAIPQNGAGEEKRSSIGAGGGYYGNGGGEVAATEKQRSLISKLMDMKDLTSGEMAKYEGRMQKGFTKKEASKIIDELQAK